VRSFEFAGEWALPLGAAALTAVALTVGIWADARFASSVLAIIGLPVAIAGAAVAERSSLRAVALAALATNAALVAYWIYDLVTTVHRGT
jgi:hypothetical protein